MQKTEVARKYGNGFLVSIRLAQARCDQPINAVYTAIARYPQRGVRFGGETIDISDGHTTRETEQRVFRQRLHDRIGHTAFPDVVQARFFDGL